MKVKKSLMTMGVVGGVVLASLASASAALAATSSPSGPGSLIYKIAQKFNLKENEVKAVFEEDRAAHQAEHQQKFEDRLTQAVTDGKLTTEQKDKIIAKAKQLETEREANKDAMKDKTPEERKTVMEAKRTELEQWAKDNNVPIEYLRFGGGPGHGGPGGGRPDMKPADN